MARLLWLLCLVASARAAGPLGGPKLSLPRALLPLPVRAQPPPALVLTVTGAASSYVWSTSRDDIVNIQPIENSNGWSTSARVSSVPHLTYRQTAIIFAEDVHTKQILRCDVIVDKIVSLEVVTTTRELFVEEAPEAFEVRAYDDQGNEFTSLEGVEFSWTIISPLKNNDVIRIMTFSDSSYEASKALQELELQGLRGHTALLEGVSTGSAKVIVKLPQPEYASVNSVEVTLRVVANLLIKPSNVCIQQHDSINLKIIQVREGRMLELPQPSSQYWLDLENDKILDLNKKTGLAIGVDLGTTRVFLRDAGEGLDGESDGVRPPEATIHVVTPYEIKLELKPSSTSSPWSLQNGDNFTIYVHIMDNQDRRIHVGPETKIALEIDESLVDVTWKSINGTVLTGRAAKVGVVPVVATLLSVAGTPVKSKISAAGKIQIFSKIEVIPSKVILPWDPNYNTRHERQLKAIGGDGTYVWQSDGSALVDSHNGLVTAIGPGKARITASMPSNPNIFGIANVIVIEPTLIKAEWYRSEGPVGSDLPIHIALFTQIPPKSEKYIPYNRCDLMHFEVVTMEGINFDLQDEKIDPETKLIGSACTVLHVKCSEIGSGMIAVRWGHLEVLISLGCYAPLQRIYPPTSHSSVLLTVGSSLNVIFTGGPVSWFGRDPDISKEIKNSQSSIATAVLHQTSNNHHVFTVTCLEIGSTEVNLKIFGANRENNGPATSFAEGSVEVLCSNPTAFKLSPRQEIGTLCPMSSAQTSMLSGGGSVEVEVTVLDEEYRVFHNASSVRVRWLSKPTSMLLEVPVERFLIRLDQKYNFPIVDYHYQMIAISDVEISKKINNIDITLEALGFRGNVLKNAGIHKSPVWNDLPQSTLSLRIIAPVQASSNKILIYNQPNNIVYHPLLHGSGSFQVDLSNDENVHVALDHSNGQSLKIQPISDGDVTVNVKDLCVNSPSAQIQISVVSVVNIVADLPELIEKGQTVECLVRFYDRSGSLLPARENGAPNLAAKIKEGRITINLSSNETNNGILYTVTGLEVSDATIEFTAGSARSIVHTHIFAPLKMIPRSSVMLPGGSVALKVVGGPPPPATIKFHKSSGPADVVDVSGSGIVSAQNMGSAGVEACAEGPRGVELACASGTVRVLPLEGVLIHAPTSTLLTGKTMPLWVTGTSENIGPIELGALQSSLHFRWSLSGDGSASIHDILSITGVEFDDTDRVSIRLKAVRAGAVTVHLNVTALPGSILAKTRVSWSARFDLTIIEPLLLIKPDIDVSSLLLTPHSSILLETNYPHDNLIYSIKEDDHKNENEPLVKISPDGRLTTFARLGRTILVISNGDSDVWSKQRMIVSIEVCAPHYAMVALSHGNSFDKLNGLAALPIGLMLPLTISKYDILGRKFATMSQNVRQLTNRPDLVSVVTNTTHTLELLLTDSGEAVIKVWDPVSEKQFSDYVSFKIQTALNPQKIVATVGDVWCMRSTIDGAKWNGSLDGAVWVGENGAAQARVSNVAATSLSLTAPDGLPYTAHAGVLIRPIDMIKFIVSDSEHIVTEEKPYTMYLVLGNHEEQNKLNNIIFDESDCLTEEIVHFPFSCEIKHNNDITPLQLTASPVFDKNKGSYGCQINWDPGYSLLSTINNSRNFSVIAKAGSLSTDTQTARTLKSARYQPETVVLSPPPASTAFIDVSATKEILKQLKVIPGDDVLKVDKPIQMSDTSFRYIIRGDGNSYGPRKLHVLLVSPLTHQRTEIPVNINGGGSTMDGVCTLGGSSPIMQLIQEYQPFLLSILLLLIIVVATVYIYGNIIYPLQTRNKEYINVGPVNDLSSQIRNMTYQSRSPLTRNMSEMSHTPPNSPNAPFTPSPNLDGSSSAIYGDPSYLASPERRRNRRFL